MWGHDSKLANRGKSGETTPTQRVEKKIWGKKRGILSSQHGKHYAQPPQLKHPRPPDIREYVRL